MATIPTAATRPSNRLPLPRDDREADEDPDPLDADVERRHAIVVHDDHDRDRRERGEDRRADQLQVVRSRSRAGVEARRQETHRPGG